MKCPIKKAKSIFEDFRRIVRRKENKCFMHLKYPSTQTDTKIISQEEMIKWADYDLPNDFLMWAIEAMQYLVLGVTSDIQIKIDNHDRQWIVVIKSSVILVMRVATVDWDTIKEELKGWHFKTIGMIIIL